jgi:tRNA G10  N-methylase Trm11
VAVVTRVRKEHPSPYSDAILAMLAEHIGVAALVLDPFAGIGRIHELRGERIGHTIGVEIEPEWASKHASTIVADAQALPFPDECFNAVSTSCTYGNRMSDHHDAKDGSVRHTYKHTLGRDLHERNSGAMPWGERYRVLHSRAWEEAVRVLKSGGTFTLNVKNHKQLGTVKRVVEWHIGVLTDLGLVLERLDPIITRGLMAGANSEQRTGHEFVITWRKEARWCS